MDDKHRLNRHIRERMEEDTEHQVSMVTAMLYSLWGSKAPTWAPCWPAARCGAPPAARDFPPRTIPRWKVHFCHIEHKSITQNMYRQAPNMLLYYVYLLIIMVNYFI